MNLMLLLIPKGKENAIKRADLRKKCGLDDAYMRSEISKVRKRKRADHVILNDQDGVGYYRPKFPDDYERVARFIKQEESRALSIWKSLESARAFLKKADNQKQCQFPLD